MIGSVKLWGLLLWALIALSSCNKSSSDDSSIDDSGAGVTPQDDDDDVDYKATFVNVNDVGLYAYGSSATKVYNRESDQIVYKSDFSDYTVTNYSQTQLYKLSFDKDITSADIITVTITSQGVDRLSDMSLTMEVIKSDDSPCYWLWSDESQVGAVVKLYE